MVRADRLRDGDVAAVSKTRVAAHVHRLRLAGHAAGSSGGGGHGSGRGGVVRRRTSSCSVG